MNPITVTHGEIVEAVYKAFIAEGKPVLTAAALAMTAADAVCPKK
jgi:hypothetical protein